MIPKVTKDIIGIFENLNPLIWRYARRRSNESTAKGTIVKPYFVSMGTAI